LKKIVIFGNSGAGKSTLAKFLAIQNKLSYLDLDTIAWEKDNPTSRKDLNESKLEINDFILKNEYWVVEGCYTSLLSIVAKECNELIFLNPGVEACVAHCKSRPWEPHKYSSPEAQNKNLEMLIDWVREYPERKDEFSLKAHQELFDSFNGVKVEKTKNYGNTE